MKSVVFLSLVIFFSVLPKYSQQTFWRKPTLPSDPTANVYQSKLKIIIIIHFEISLEVDCFHSQYTRKYLHSGTKSSGWLRYGTQVF